MSRTYETNHIAQIKIGANGTALTLDPDYLGGKPASYYASASDVVGLLEYKGTFNTDYTPSAHKGDVYVVTNGHLTINGITCDSGDMWICKEDIVAADSSNVTDVNAKWDIVQGNIDRSELDNTYSNIEHTHTLADIDYTPAGTIVLEEGAATDFSYTPAGDVSDAGHTHTASATYTPNGVVEGDGSHQHNVIATGTITAHLLDSNGSHNHTIGFSKVATDTPDVLTAVKGTGALTGEVDGNGVLTLSHTDGIEPTANDPSKLIVGSSSSNTVPETTETITVNVTGTAEAVGHSHTFTGTEATITSTIGSGKANLTFAGTEAHFKASFTGTAATFKPSINGYINTPTN